MRASSGSRGKWCRSTRCCRRCAGDRKVLQQPSTRHWNTGIRLATYTASQHGDCCWPDAVITDHLSNKWQARLVSFASIQPTLPLKMQDKPDPGCTSIRSLYIGAYAPAAGALMQCNSPGLGKMNRAPRPNERQANGLLEALHGIHCR